MLKKRTLKHNLIMTNKTFLMRCTHTEELLNKQNVIKIKMQKIVKFENEREKFSKKMNYILVNYSHEEPQTNL